ncbi:MAG: phospholipase D-like domain-containing protein [Vicinamibacterales bacterium]
MPRVTPALREQRIDWSAVRQLADQAFARTSGAPLRDGNDVVLLRNASENYPAWLDAIAQARQTIHFEMYIISEDQQGRLFADALIARARAGVRVRVLYDWLGGFGKTSRAFWRNLREGGVEVRSYNPPRFDRPFGWVSRDHRKLIVVDGETAFVTGLCVGQEWVGDARRHIDPWRDTGMSLRGPAVADVAAAFAEAWEAVGDPLPEVSPAAARAVDAGDVSLRVVATVPNTAGLFRVDQLVAAMARRTLWLTDAYYGGTTAYVQALRSAALDGVDVRLLVPGATDIPLIRPFSRAGYRPLLDAGVRVFEWNGSMIHAKTAVADGQWARVGSSNLNIASWMGNRELDVIVEHPGFAAQMEEMFLADLENATEVVLTKNRVRVPGAPLRRRQPSAGRRGSGSSGRMVAGAVRVGRTVAAAITNTRVLESVEANIALIAGGLLAGLAVLTWLFPRAIAYPLAAIAAWLGLALLYRGFELYRRGRGPVNPLPGDE